MPDDVKPDAPDDRTPAKKAALTQEIAAPSRAARRAAWRRGRAADAEAEALPLLQPLPSRAERIALRILQVGAVALVLVATTHRLFDLDRFFIPKELVLHATAFAAGLFMLGAARRMTVTRVDVLLAAFLGVSALSAVLAQNPWAAGRALAISVSGVAVFWVARGLRRAGLGRPLVAALAFGIVLAAVTALLQAYGVRTDLFTLNRAPGGLLGNRNFIGHLAAFGFPVVLFSLLRAERARGFLLGASGGALLVAALVLTRSRAAWLGFGIVAAVLLCTFVLTPSVRRDFKILRRFVLLLVFVAGGVAAALTLPNALRWKSDDPYAETARQVLNYREGSGKGRLIQYQTSVKMTLSHPLFGVGPGNWSVNYMDHAGRNDPSRSFREAGMTANPWPSSDWVALLSERGLAGFILFLLIGLALVRAAWRGLRTADDPGEGLAAVALLAVAAGVAVVGAFDAALLLAWPTFFFWAAAGVFWPTEGDAPPPRPVRPALRVVALLALTLLAGAGALRSTGQIAAMDLYSADQSREGLELAARLDPGNYRLHLRLAQRTRRSNPAFCHHAQAAHNLYPTAAEAARLARRCK